MAGEPETSALKKLGWQVRCPEKQKAGALGHRLWRLSESAAL